MSGRAHVTRLRVAIPHIGPSLPTAALPLLFLSVAAALCLLVLSHPAFLALGLLLALLAVLAPSHVPSWWLLLLLGLSQFWREPSATDAVYYLLLAGLHLLHLLGSLARQLPWNGRIQVGVLAGPLRRYLLVQAVVQPVTASALVAFGSGPGGVAGLSLVAALLLCVLAVALGTGRRPADARI